MILLITVPVLANNKDETIEELRSRLEKSNETIEKLIDTIEDKNSKIEELEQEKSKLVKDLDKKTKKVKELRGEVQRLSSRLEKSNDTINDLVNRIIKDQEEITNLRKQLEDTSTYVEDDAQFIAAIAPTYPLGGQAIFAVDINGLPFGIYSSFSMDTNMRVQGSLGVLYEF
jgi:predicted nuclease with TOPRIM domain